MAQKPEQLALLEDVRRRILKELDMVILEAMSLNEELSQVNVEIEEVNSWN